MANYNLRQTGDEVQAYIDSIPVIDVTGTLSGSVVVFTTNPYPQVAANYEAGCGSIIRLTVGEDIHLIPITRFDGTAYKGSTMTGWNNVVATIEATSASAIVAISGIDDAPTAGSKNPVTSTGINTSLQTLQNEIDSIQPIVIEGNVTNAPDEEDITTDSNDLLKFKNRVPGLNQLGYFILRRDQTFAAQVTETNTVYEVRYDFDLNGQTVNLPAGSVLKFGGGALSNGTLENAYINASRVKIFSNVSFLNLKNAEIFPEWFGAIPDGTTDSSLAFEESMSLGKAVSLSNGTYLVVNQITCSAYASIVGENKTTSIIKTNGFVPSVGTVIQDVTLRSISKSTPFLLKVTTNNLPSNEYLSGIVVNNVVLRGAEFTEYDTGVTGIVFEVEANSNVLGFYDVNVHDVELAGKMLYGFYFNAKSTNAWMSFCNFHDIFINGAKYPIEFATTNTGGNFYNFQNLCFERVVAQYNYDTSVNPSATWTQSFVRLAHCSRVSFDSCGCVDMASGFYPYYFKDSYNLISVKNEIERTVSGMFANANDTNYQKLITLFVTDVPTTQQKINSIHFMQASLDENTAFDAADSPTRSLIYPKSIPSEKFVGFGMTNNLQMYSGRREMLIGMVEGHIVHSGQTSPGGTFTLGAVYSTKYVPIYTNSFPTGWARGTFLYWTGLRHLLCYDNSTGQWADALNARITTNVTKRRGATADRTAMTMYSYNDGFLFYDTDLKKYVLWNGSSWVNVDGTAL